MNRERAKELTPIIQAYGEGKNVEFRPVDGASWISADFSLQASLKFEDYMEYRIKPEPKEYWLVDGYYFLNLKDAQIERAKGTYAEIIHVREIIE